MIWRDRLKSLLKRIAKEVIAIKHRLDFNKINSYIYIGSNGCCQVHFSSRLLRKGIRADISLENNRIDFPLGIDYFLWLPTRDHTAPSQKQLILGSNAIDNLVRNKVRMYVHCKNGHGRAPTLVAAYLISKGMAIDAAVRMLKNKRKSVHLNSMQIKALKRFARTVE